MGNHQLFKDFLGHKFQGYLHFGGRSTGNSSRVSTPKNMVAPTVTSVNARCHIYTRLIGPLLITPQLPGVIKPSRPRLVPSFYESLAELLVSQFMEFGTTSDFKAVSCPSRLVSVDPGPNSYTTLLLLGSDQASWMHPINSPEQHWAVQQFLV